MARIPDRKLGRTVSDQRARASFETGGTVGQAVEHLQACRQKEDVKARRGDFEACKRGLGEGEALEGRGRLGKEI